MAQASGLAGRIRRQPVRVRRMPSASGGPSTSPAAASRDASAGRSSNMLKRLAALFVPSRAHASTASAAASTSSSSRAASSGVKVERTWSIAVRSGSPMPTRSRLNFSVPSSSMIERRPLWPPAPPPSRNRSLPNGSAKSSATTRRSLERRALAGQDLADGEPRLVHVRQRLDERQVEASIAAADDVRRVSLATAAVPAGAVGDAVHDPPADVVPRPGVLRTRVAEPDDKLHKTSMTRRSSPGPTVPGHVLRWYPVASFARRGGPFRAHAWPSRRRVRRGPSRRRAGCRGSRAAAVRPPRTSGRRPSGRHDPRTPARPRARPRRPRRRGAGASSAGAATSRPRPRARRPRAAGAGTRARPSDRSFPCVRRSVRPAPRRRRGSARSRPAMGPRPRRAPTRPPATMRATETGGWTPSPDGRHRSATGRGRSARGHEAEPLPPPRAPGATRARRPCSAGTRSECGTSRAAGRRTPRGSARGRAA